MLLLLGLVATACGGAGAGSAGSSGTPALGRLYGYVTAVPGCAVEQAGNPCRRALSGKIEAQTLTGVIVATTSSDTQGRFDFTLAAQRYVLRVRAGSVALRCHSVVVAVRAAETARADIRCDSGIR